MIGQITGSSTDGVFPACFQGITIAVVTDANASAPGVSRQGWVLVILFRSGPAHNAGNSCQFTVG